MEGTLGSTVWTDSIRQISYMLKAGSTIQRLEVEFYKEVERWLDHGGTDIINGLIY